MTDTPSALQLLTALDDHTRARGIPGPAALIGDWAGSDAVIAPSVSLSAGMPIPDRPQRFWFGYHGFGVHAQRSPLPDVVGGLSDDVLLLRDGHWQYRHVDDRPLPTWLAQCIDTAADFTTPPNEAPWSASWTPPQRAPHVAAIAECLEAIRAGEIYQACVCTQFVGQFDGSPLDYFVDLASATTPAKAAFLQGDWGAVTSFSPELFLSRRGAQVTSSPIKGTIAASGNPETLRASTKDVAENIMIVDLVRNDLGHVAQIGSVTVDDLLSVVPAPGVWHLVSTVSATLDDTVGNESLLDAAFPPASVTGTPKIRACELLADWEPQARGVYCGAIGFAGPDHELDLNVAIRTVQISPDGSATLGVGGGITIDSNPEREWQECLDKASSIVAFERRCSPGLDTPRR
ncbi:putative anthranilate synthase component I [Gordonia effusa NBRC 100432]|uniref:Putative anthranilate synthase component I n=1 Tax=Gordonia effusa NBRC 100432 TaxID=1077974 RepID=H0QUQ7_9ACTN|nr:aminodeoxychorismate synthase component I [Gordonia effusa]GAB16558.1 putative anthranilate synthase component I [Gordonia effusa NBRC 100432]